MENGDATDDASTASRRLRRWALLEGGRLVVAGSLLSIVVAFLLALALSGFVPDTPASSLNFLFSSVLGANVTLVTVVLSINQLVLSRELGSPGELREEIDDAVGYREDVEELTDRAASPTDPEAFLYALHESLADRARTVSGGVEGAADGETRARVVDLVEWILADVDRVAETLERDDPATFSVVAATIETDHADQLEEIARIQSSGNDLPDEVATALDEIGKLLLEIDVARRYFRTVYVQKELAFLSRVLLYVGFPAVLAATAVLLLLGVASTSPLPPDIVRWSVVSALAIGLAPLAVLFSFVLRTAYVAQRTASVAPFSTGRDYQP